MKKSKIFLKNTLKWLGVAFNVLLVTVVILNLYTIAMRFITKKEVVPVFGIATALVETGSMAGEKNDSIEGFTLIFTVKSNEYEIDDIITFDTGGSVPTTHRIIGVEGELFVTQGDSNNTEDIARVSKEQIIGKVFFTIPGVGYFVHFMKTPLGMLILVLVCFLLIAGPTIFKPMHDENSEAENTKIKPENGEVKNTEPQNEESRESDK